MITDTYLTDPRDRILFGETPTYLQPLFGDKLPAPALGKHRFVMGQEGVVLEAVNEVLEVRLPVARSIIPLPYGALGEPGIRLRNGPIPRPILETIEYKAASACPNEWAGWVIWDVVQQRYALFEPAILSVGSGHVSYRNRIPSHAVLVLDLHSHGLHPAYFSETDDLSDQQGFYVAGVIGHCQGPKSYASRMNVNGHFFDGVDFRSLFQ
ncbi:PRTRC system protein A [Methylomonas sp. UP202]|uniref:PRTRC system protein A n=1 Tax=Methylomonas sp. UP202 TaxID=3040943 RepID=UPI00247AD937|nr:PRTRC system protein A [Methylomonas sp. UP202]WGS88575.1 PRTRC system protein A [Methylomonas sp. UP202]